jgi:hypothetical protein
VREAYCDFVDAMETPQEVVTHVCELEAAGLTQVLLLPPTDFAPKVLTDFATKHFPMLAVPTVA